MSESDYKDYTAYEVADDSIQDPAAPLDTTRIKVQLEASRGENKMILEVKPRTTVRRLREHWAQHLERQHPDVPVDISRLVIYPPDEGYLGLEEAVKYLPTSKKHKLPTGERQDVVCLKVQRLGIEASETAYGLATQLRVQKAGAVPRIWIHVKQLTGRTTSFRVDRTETILNLKEYLQDREGTPPDLQRLVHDCVNH